MTKTQNGDLPDEIVRFLENCIDSVEQLETLLLLFRSRPRCWSAEEISRELLSNDQSIRRRLEDLKSHNLIIEKDDRFCPSDERDGKFFDLLDKVYRERRIRVIDLIFSKPRGSIQSFIKAFKIRKED